jgi:hypothetical protein
MKKNEDDPVAFAPSFQVRAFTDNLVIGYPIDPQIGASIAILHTMTYLTYFQAELACQGYFIRGGIAVGDLYIDEDIVFGPALIEAHEAEQNLAVFPRIILCQSAEDVYKDEKATPHGFLADSDNRAFIDYLDDTVMLAYPDAGPFMEFLDRHKTAVILKMKQFAAAPYIRAKYEWAAKYHNWFCDRYPNAFGEDDKIPSDLLQISPTVWNPEQP